MIHGIVAMDNMRGIADHQGIAWKLPTDTKYFKDKVKDKIILMGKGTYDTHPLPLSNVANYVLTDEPVAEGFTAIQSLAILNVEDDVWILGGANVFKQTLPYIDKLYITRVDGYFSSNTKFFPEYKQDFTLIDAETKQTENGIDFYWEVWKRSTLV